MRRIGSLLPRVSSCCTAYECFHRSIQALPWDIILSCSVWGLVSQGTCRAEVGARLHCSPDLEFMRVLWFTNEPMPPVLRRRGQSNLGSGHWMSSLLENLVRTPGMQVEVVTFSPGSQDEQFEEDGVTYFVFGQPKQTGIFF